MYSGNTYGGSFGNHNTYSGYNSVSTANISYETNSKDPVLLRARVFVGNLNPKVGREEIIQLFRAYGTLLGVTVFKGYAFVQFSHGSEADVAVSNLNGYNWLGNVLDVKLAISGQHQQAYQHPKTTSHLAVAVSNTAKGMGKRNQFVPSTANHQKRAKVDHGGMGHQDGKINKEYAAQLNSNDLALIQQHEAQDTLICGECHFSTADLAGFVEHRKQPCHFPKPDGEPDVLGCTNCDEQFQSSWALLSHLSSTHNNTLYKEVFYTKHGENGADEEPNIKNESDVSMQEQK